MNKKTTKSNSSDQQFKSVNDFLKTISDQNRLRILQVLGDKTLSVGDIYKKLKLPQNLTSHHISRLKKVELLNEKKDGTFRLYSVNMKKLKEHDKAVHALLGF